MKCHKCGKNMKYSRQMKFNEYKINGWKCSCGEIYYDPDQAQRVLLLNKLKKEVLTAKLGRMRSNLILRLPKDLERALTLKKGVDVTIKVDDQGFRIIPVA